MNSSRRCIIVSNRLPVQITEAEQGFRLQASSGGLVSALRPVLRDTQACWIGWAGNDDPSQFPAPLHDYAGCSLVPVFLTAAEKACFYRGYCNEIIWPLFHDLQSRCNFDPGYWQVYREVNEKFADVVEQQADPDDFVWVHDYHLMLLGQALRARKLGLRLAYFQHIPFPPPDIFEKLPWRAEILRGLLQFETIGFQTSRDQRNFIASLRRCLRDVRVHNTGRGLLVRASDSCSLVGTFPISIDFHQFAAQALDTATVAHAAEVQRSIPGEQLILGVDRLDYTKGIPYRLLAFRRLLECNPELQGRVTLLQVVVPSREEIPSYRDLKLSIERLVGEINGEFGTAAWAPVVYWHRSLPQSELVALYRAADIALVTPLKDGMNLVAKEFCASRVEHGGVLVLSEFAGAATELKCGALLVNPYDTEGVAAALYRAFRMSGREQRIRMLRMRNCIRLHDVFRWSRTFFEHAAPHQLPMSLLTKPVGAWRQPALQAVAAD